MDSANSGSIQSSSGRDHESNQQDFDDSMAAASHQLQFLPHNHHQTPNFFDNHDLVWPRAGEGLRSDSNFAFFGTLTTPPSSSLPSTATDPMATVQTNAFLGGASSSMDHVAGRPPSNAIKNPKKRTRASRRAPTTVLTTDVTNFRQMVQEFTGIPASPFTGSPYSRSFDLFSAASALRTGANLHPFRPLYPPRPSAASKLPSPFSSTNPIAIGNSNNPNDETAATNPSNNYHHLFNLQHQQRNLPLQLGEVNAPMNLSNLSGFLNRETLPPSLRSNDGDGRIWKSGETVGRTINDGGGIELNHDNIVGFDGSAARGPPPQLSGYNLNIVAEKGMENPATGSASSSGATAAAGEGTVGSWICTSH